VEEVLQVIRNRLRMDHSFPERSPLQVEDVIKLLDICLANRYFQFGDKFYQSKECMAMGNLLSLVVSNIFMEHFEQIALDTATLKPLNGSDSDDTSMVLPYGPVKLQQFLPHLNSIRNTIKFTMEVEANGTLPFLDILVMKRGAKFKLETKCTRNLYIQDVICT
jgi:hypothetical protein